MTVEGAGAAATAHPATAPVASARTIGVALGVATAVGHALSYAFSVVLSRALGPADFGALGALLGIAVVAGVPAAGLQTQVARVAATTPTRPAIRRGYRQGWVIGAGLALGLVAAAGPLAGLLRLDGPLAVLALAVGIVPVCALGARQGVLLGRAAFLLLGVAAVLVPALRLVGAVVAAHAGMGVAGAVGMQSAATWLGLVAVMALVGTLSSPEVTTIPPRMAGPSVGSLLRASSGLFGLFVLANVDVLLARVFLTDTESGIYAVGAMAAKVVFWGSQFVALLVFPRVARGEAGRELVLRAGVLVAAAGGIAAVVAVPLAGPVLDLLVGPAYAAAAGLAPWFVVLGTLLALVQLSTYTAVAADRHRFALLLWATVVLQVLAIALGANGSMGQILAVCILGTGGLAGAAGVIALRGAQW